MDTLFLESFVAVADHGSLAEAARRLNVTPAAIAQRVHTLEIEVGAALLTRSGRRMRPTVAGEAILMRARDVLADVRDLRTLAGGGSISGELRLGAITTALTGLLPDTLKRLMASYPGLEMYLEPGTSVDLYQRVLEGALDAAFIVRPHFAVPKTVTFTLLRNEPFVLIAERRHAGRTIHDLLSAEPFIRYDRKHWGGNLADACLRRLCVRPRERFELDSLETIAVLVGRDLGVSLVPDWSPPWPEGVDLLKLPVTGSEGRPVGVLFPLASPRRHLVDALLTVWNAHQGLRSA